MRTLQNSSKNHISVCLAYIHTYYLFFFKTKWWPY